MSEDKAETNSTGVSLPVTATAQVAKDLMELAKNDSNTVGAAKNFGESALIVSKAVKNCLLPLAAVNFGIDKAKIYFQQRFTKDLEEKTQHIPPENIIEPKASIAGPALQGLAFCHEEAPLKEMYLELIASSMNIDSYDNTHPAFVEVIKQLTSIEAEILPIYLESNTLKPVGRVIYKNIEDNSIIVSCRHILELYTGDEPYYDKRIPSFVDNWIRLGLIEVGYDKYMGAQEERYIAIKDREEYINDKTYTHEKLTKEFERGYIRRTSFGALFSQATGIINKNL
jgi:hypothetical protein